MRNPGNQNSLRDEKQSLAPAVTSTRKAVVFGWIISLAGTALWIYGYFATGTPSLIDWHADTPWWIADFMPNLESEVGMALVFSSMIPIYWPPRA